MDPLTHTLVGANLAATRLGRSTRLAAAALAVGANAPDIAPEETRVRIQDVR